MNEESVEHYTNAIKSYQENGDMISSSDNDIAKELAITASFYMGMVCQGKDKRMLREMFQRMLKTFPRQEKKVYQCVPQKMIQRKLEKQIEDFAEDMLHVVNCSTLVPNENRA